MRLRSSIKARLTLATLVPLSVAILICWLAGVFILSNLAVSQARDKVRNDLNAAREVYNHELGQIRDTVRITAAASSASDAFARGDRERLASLLAPLIQGERLDFFTAVDAGGRVLLRVHDPGRAGDDRCRNRFVARALRGDVVAGTALLSAAELAAEGAELAGRAAVPIHPTPHARPRGDAAERRGMVLMAAVPVRTPRGEVIGALYGGVLLNNTTLLVDKIKNLVYEGVRYRGESVGSATIFLGDLRIATNVLTATGGRAVGTRMSAEVHARVIQGGEKWLDRAFVVDQWYVTAYEPILSLDGVPIGALYVGMQERPFTAVNVNMGLIYSGVLLVGALFGMAVSWVIGDRLTRPVRALETAARRVAAGERQLPIEVGSHDEIGALAAEFNQMTQTLRQREEAISELNRDLERKVTERTAELEEKNRLLLQAREELVRAEKLAAVGELAAGVAHEINNPLAIIRGNAELLQMSVAADAANREEVDTIYQQAGRMERIVANLLTFARRQGKELGTVALNAMLAEIVSQVGHQLPVERIAIRERYAEELTEIGGDEGQLRQVFTNLVLNAIQAMPAGGTLTLETALHGSGGSCLVTVADTGVGIPAENLGQIFNPFFTTRAGGTGLGLSLSYGIIEEHGGAVEVQSAPGRGTTFTVTLPVRQG